MEQLWRQLDTKKKGELDLHDLQKGLHKIDHRQQAQYPLRNAVTNKFSALKNATNLLADVLKAVDTSGDGKIQYEGKLLFVIGKLQLVLSCVPFLAKLLTNCPPEFRIFVEHTEKELYSLFQSIDKDRNGKLDKKELQAAFKHAGLQVLPSKLNQFFSEVDTDHDGAISFEEWR